VVKDMRDARGIHRSPSSPDRSDLRGDILARLRCNSTRNNLARPHVIAFYVRTAVASGGTEGKGGPITRAIPHPR
jgi:hypothetical protein